MFEMREEKIRK